MIWSVIEEDSQFNERIAATKGVVAEVVQAVVRQVGHAGARRMFLKALKRLSPGPQPDGKANARRLEAYDRQIALGVPRRRASRAAAEELATEPNDDAESIAKHIRTLIKERAKAALSAQAEGEWLKKLSPLLLEEGRERA